MSELKRAVEWHHELTHTRTHLSDTDEYVIGPFRRNNVTVPTRYADLPYRFHLDEHRVKARLVEETARGAGRDRKGEWVLEKYTRDK